MLITKHREAAKPENRALANALIELLPAILVHLENAALEEHMKPPTTKQEKEELRLDAGLIVARIQSKRKHGHR